MKLRIHTILPLVDVNNLVVEGSRFCIMHMKEAFTSEDVTETPFGHKVSTYADYKGDQL